MVHMRERLRPQSIANFAGVLYRHRQIYLTVDISLRNLMEGNGLLFTNVMHMTYGCGVPKRSLAVGSDAFDDTTVVL